MGEKPTTLRVQSGGGGGGGRGQRIPVVYFRFTPNQFTLPSVRFPATKKYGFCR